jgi:CMP-N,N'-diacetyllegionaminic acid synthase
LVAKKPRILGVIAARGGSKRIPGKNLEKIGGVTLLEWSVNAARASSSIDKLIVSTDCDAIMAEAERLSVEAPFVRPPDLSSDSATSFGVVEHAVLSEPGFDWVLLLQPTSPFRTSYDIDNIVNMMVERQGRSAVSATKFHHDPKTMFVVDVSPETQSQTNIMVGEKIARKFQSDFFILNGALFLIEIKYLLKIKRFFDGASLIYEMPRERSVDIDTKEDLASARLYYFKEKGDD